MIAQREGLSTEVSRRKPYKGAEQIHRFFSISARATAQKTGPELLRNGDFIQRGENLVDHTLGRNGELCPSSKPVGRPEHARVTRTHTTHGSPQEFLSQIHARDQIVQVDVINDSLRLLINHDALNAIGHRQADFRSREDVAIGEQIR